MRAGAFGKAVLVGAGTLLLAPGVLGAPECEPGCPPDFVCTEFEGCALETRAPGPTTPTNLVAVDAVVHSRYVFNDVRTIVAPVLRAVFVENDVTFEPELPLLYYAADAPEAGLLVGNATASVKYHWVDGPRDLSLFAGAGLSLPMVSAEANGAGGAYLIAAGARGLWNVWWYLSDAMSFFFPVGVRRVNAWGLDWGAEAAGGFAIPLKLAADQRPLGIMQGGLHVGYASERLEAGLRLRLARVPGNDARDPFQTSAEPYARIFVGAAYLGAGIVFNVDRPYGPFYDPNSVWGARLEFGVRY